MFLSYLRIYFQFLFQTLNQSIDIFLNKYTSEDGSLIWDSKISGRDGGDDFYEAFSNWSLFYILGGRSDLGVIAFKQWKAITKQLNHLGVTFNDYELGYDWFHQSESNIFFYYLCWANPANSDLIQLSEKFGEMYLDKPKSPGNYDSEKILLEHLIMAVVDLDGVLVGIMIIHIMVSRKMKE